jgi:hypothetical protein
MAVVVVSVFVIREVLRILHSGLKYLVRIKAQTQTFRRYITFDRYGLFKHDPIHHPLVGVITLSHLTSPSLDLLSNRYDALFWRLALSFPVLVLIELGLLAESSSAIRALDGLEMIPHGVLPVMVRIQRVE